MTPKEIAEAHVKAADQFATAGTKNAVLSLAAFGLTIVEDVRGGRFRPRESFVYFNTRYTSPSLTTDPGERQFLRGIQIMVGVAYETQLGWSK